MKLNWGIRIIRAEHLTIFETFPAFNVLRKENWQLFDPDEPTEWDDYEVVTISGKGSGALYIFLEKKE